MVSFFGVVMLIIGILLIFVYPKIVRWFIVLFILYMSVAYSWHYSIILIPLLLIMFYYKRRKERNG